jgi:hypothetical protein
MAALDHGRPEFLRHGQHLAGATIQLSIMGLRRSTGISGLPQCVVAQHLGCDLSTRRLGFSSFYPHAMDTPLGSAGLRRMDRIRLAALYGRGDRDLVGPADGPVGRPSKRPDFTPLSAVDADALDSGCARHELRLARLLDVGEKYTSDNAITNLEWFSEALLGTNELPAGSLYFINSGS